MPHCFPLVAYIFNMNRSSGVEVLVESILQMGWDVAMSKFIVVPITEDYQRFLECLPDAHKAFDTTQWTAKTTEEKGFYTQFKSS